MKMKNLFIIRHAKSSTNFLNNNDFERPLNEQGIKDAALMAKKLLSKGIIIDGIVTSTAIRAATTANYFATAFAINKNNFWNEPTLYNANKNTFYTIINNWQFTLNNIAIFFHNPGITHFANSVTNSKIDNMPPCGVFAIKINCNKWQNFETAEKEFWFFDCPEKIW